METMRERARIVIDELSIRYGSWRKEVEKDNKYPSRLIDMDRFHQAVLGYIESMLIFDGPPEIEVIYE